MEPESKSRAVSTKIRSDNLLLLKSKLSMKKMKNQLIIVAPRKKRVKDKRRVF